jgi:hypothetical protein
MIHLLMAAWTFFASCADSPATAERHYDAGDDSSAVRLLESAVRDEPDCPEAPWKLAYVRLAEANRETDPGKRIALWTTGRNLSDRAISKFPRSGGAWFASALALGVESTISGARRRVELSKVLRERVGRALSLDPGLAGGWYLLAKWHEGLVSLNFAERGFANLLLGGLPKGASDDSARAYLGRALTLRPDDPLLLLELARNLERAKLRTQALAVCRRANGIGRSAPGDRKNLEDIASLRRKLESMGS